MQSLTNEYKIINNSDFQNFMDHNHLSAYFILNLNLIKYHFNLVLFKNDKIPLILKYHL